MAKIDVHYPEGLKGADKIEAIFTEMIGELTSRMFSVYDYDENLPLSVRRELASSAAMDSQWKIVGTANGTWYVNGPGIGITRRIYEKEGFLIHGFFEITSGLQNKKLSDIVMKASLGISDLLDLNSIVLDANLDIGGYAWLRKGAWPDDGLKTVIEKNSHFDEALANELLLKIGNRPRVEQQAFVLSNDFKKYKKLFLGTSWYGSFDPNDPVTRVAMTEGAEAAFKIVVKNNPIPTAVQLTSNEQILNDFIKQQMKVLSYSSTLARQNYKLLADTEEKLAELLTYYSDRFAKLGSVRSPEAVQLFKELEAKLLAARAGAWEQVNANVYAQAQAYAAAESKATATIVQGAVPVALNLAMPTLTTLQRVVAAQPFEGRILKDWLARTEAFDHARITKLVKSSIVDGVTPTELTRSIIGTASLKGTDGVTRKAFKDLESVLLTVNSGIQNEVRQMLYQENSDVFNEEYFVATLDIHTTYECAGHDGEKFKIGTGLMPPLHFRCRSLRIAYIAASVLNNRPYKPVYEKMLMQEFSEKNGIKNYKTRDALPKGFKTRYDQYARERTRELVGQVPATTNFQTFLKNQTKEFQNEYLGVARANAFRKGELSIQNFSNSSGRVYTIEELGIPN